RRRAAARLAVARDHDRLSVRIHRARRHFPRDRRLDPADADPRPPSARADGGNRLRASRVDRPAGRDSRGWAQLPGFAADGSGSVGGAARRRASTDPAGAANGPVDERGAEGDARAHGHAGMRTFVRSVLQGESLGTSTGQIMRNLAVEMRKRRRAAAEERAQKAPVKILFPLVFLIFPAMFIVLLGPTFYSIGKIFGATG